MANFFHGTNTDGRQEKPLAPPGMDPLAAAYGGYRVPTSAFLRPELPSTPLPAPEIAALGELFTPPEANSFGYEELPAALDDRKVIG
jgi:hypothetical protein